MFAPLAEAYRKAGMFEDALGALEIGLSRHPKYIPGHIVSGRCYLDLKDEVKAEESFSKVMELDPENVIALKALADLAERHGRREVAIERLQRLLDFDPANEDALAQLARVAAEPVAVVVPVIDEEEPAAPVNEVVIGQGEVIDPARAEFEVQLFQPIELIPIESTEFQVPNDAESLRIHEPEPFSLAEPPAPVDDEVGELSTSLPAEPPLEPIATLDEIRWASDGLDLRPAPETVDVEIVSVVAEVFEPGIAEVVEPVRDDHPPDVDLEVAVPPVEAAPAAPSPDPPSAAVVDSPPRQLTLDPTLLQLPVIPPLAPVRPAPPVAVIPEDLTPVAVIPEDLTPATEEPDATVTEASAGWVAPESVADPEGVGLAEHAAPAPSEAATAAGPDGYSEPEPVAAPEHLTATGPSGYTEPKPAAAQEPVTAPERLTAEAMGPAGFTEPEPTAESEHLTATAQEPPPKPHRPTVAAAETEPVVESESPTDAPVTIAAGPAEPAPPPAPERLTATAEDVPAAADVPTMAAILAGSAVPEPAAEDEGPSVIEPELVVTETMAEVFLRQGYTDLALAVYSQLALREPGNQRIEAAKARLQTELAPAAPGPASEVPVRQLAVATTGGRPATTWLAQVFAVGPPRAAAPVHPPAFEPPAAAEPTRAATDTLSLSSVFGDEPVPPAPADSSQTLEESGPSFDEFFGTPAEAAPITGDAPSGSGQPIEDLEQFNAWLKGLKR
jgi:hypothetical protein